MPDKLNPSDLEISKYLENRHIHWPGKAAVALEFDSIDEVAALLESIGQCLQMARTDFVDASDQLRSSEAIGYAMQIQKLGDLQAKLEEIWRDCRGTPATPKPRD